MIKFYIGLLLLLSTYTYSQSPCPGLDSLLYGTQWYHTVQIGSQCWLKENLNVGNMVLAVQSQTNNGVLEKYCYNDSISNCTRYGGLYQWNEIMQYVSKEGSKGICPLGWHIPANAEYTILSTSVNNDGNALKKIGQGDYAPGTDKSGFSAMLAGERYENGPNSSFTSIGLSAVFWSSTYGQNPGTSYAMGLSNNFNYIGQSAGSILYGLSIRCIKDNLGSLNLQSPNGGESWVGGSIQYIKWAESNVANIRIELSTDNGTSWANIIDIAPAAPGSYKWLVPNIYSSNCRIGISDLGNLNTLSISSNVFTISKLVHSPCHDIPTVDFGGQVYNTVQIGYQCWLKENLNIGTRINENQPQLNNDTLEKYCLNDDPANCTIYGGLYQWREAVQYTPQPTPRGLCPAGWHVPLNTEYNTLALFFNNDGNALKEVGQGDGTNISGFSALLMNGQANFYSSDNYLSYVGNNGTYNLNAGYLSLGTGAGINIVGRPAYPGVVNPNSIRCLRDTSELLILSPHGGESWQVGSKHNISWGGILVDKKIKIDYTTNNGVSWLQILDSTPAGDGDYNWTVPNTPSTNCTVRITDLNNPSSTVISAASFSVTNTCPEDLTVSYDGKIYTTALIGNYCWLKENINIGTMIPGIQEAVTNGIIEKYCYNNDTANCTIYGGLYKPTELSEPGICPPGWHLPYYNAFDNLLATILYDGNALKAVGQGAGGGAGTNTSGFSLLLAGTRNGDGTFSDLGYQTWIQHIFGLYSSSGTIFIRDDYPNILVGSVRCIWDNTGPLSLVSPNGGENWKVDTIYNIIWGNINVPNVRIDYSTDDGTNWINIIESTPSSSNNYSWKVPNTVSKYCKVKISDVLNQNSNIISNKAFRIYKLEPCPGIPFVDYGGQRYNTIAIGDQCWLKENLNVGIMLDSLQLPGNNGVIEKYCYYNDSSICAIYGGLYQWDEAMQYASNVGAKGICPNGWHIPSWNEFTILTNLYDNNGDDIKAVGQGTGRNISGFSALLSGAFRTFDGSSVNLGFNTDIAGSDYCLEISASTNIYKEPVYKYFGQSIRCINDSSISAIPVELISFTASVNDNNIKLNWSTSTETNTSSFDIEKKTSNTNAWQNIASIKASGNSTTPKQYSYIDKNVNSGKYNYRLKMIDLDGSYKYSNIVNAEIVPPAKYELSNAYPNPWNPITIIRYQVPTNILVTIKVFDALGREVSTLVNEIKPAGSYEVTFTAKGLSSGTYYYQMKAGTFIETKKITLLK